MKISLKEKITRFLNSLCDELRACIEHRNNKPKTPKLHKIGSLAIVFCIVLYVFIGCFGVIRSSAADVPTNLTGYTVTVPAGWSSLAGYGEFNLEGSVIRDNISIGDFSYRTGYFNFRIGYPGAGSVTSANSLAIYTTSSNGTYYGGTPTRTFTFNITGGYDVSNPSLIQWLVDNNATFVNNNVPTTVNVPAGLYFLQNTYNDLRGTINFSVPFLSKSSFFSSIEFVGVENNQYLAIDYVDSQDNITDVFYASEGWQDAEYSVILIQTDTTLSAYEYEIFSSAFVSFADNPDLQTLFSAGQLNGQSFGYSQGYSAGESAGYQNGFANGQAEGMSQGFMSNFFGGIVQALDALKLFGSFSVLNIIEGVFGLMLALWILKLIAGG